VRAAFAIAAAFFGIAWLARYRLRDYPYPLDIGAALAGARDVVDVTGVTAALVWTVVGTFTLAVGRWLRRRSDLSVGEAAAAAVVLLWAGAYLALLLLGPLGLYRAWVLRALLGVTIAAALLTSRGRAARRPRVRGDAGAILAGAAFVLAAGPLLVMQLGSPVSPFMDVLPYVASTEKVVTFQYYEPLENDAAGIWPPSRQVPGCDGVLSLLALVVGQRASVTITSLIVPMAALNVLALYLLGRHLGSGLTGGMACLFLLQTFFWRRSADVRSTALAFPLIAVGLVFLLGRRRGGIRAALGAAALGLAVAVNPLIGAFGMQVASFGTLVEWLDFRRGFVVRVLALAAGCLLALPTVLIGLAIRTPLWTLGLPALGGGLVLAGLARADRRVLQHARGEPTPYARFAAIVGTLGLALYLHASRESELLNNDYLGYPVLALLTAFGLLVLATAVWRRPARAAAAALPALALLAGMLDFGVVGPLRFQGALEQRALASEVIPKITIYWSPYWMALLAGAAFGMLARRWAVVPAVVLALLLVVYPVRFVKEPLDFDGAELSLAGTWGFHLTHAARGYWAGRGDRRWVLDQNWRAVADLLMAEVRAGRIDYHTHVLVLSSGLEAVELPLATGISVDIVSPQFHADSYWNLGSRARALDAVPEAFAKEPRYVIVNQLPPANFPQLAAYDEVAVHDYVRLYRRKPGGAATAS
jgi:hypothetical protein